MGSSAVEDDGAAHGQLPSCGLWFTYTPRLRHQTSEVKERRQKMSEDVTEVTQDEVDMLAWADKTADLPYREQDVEDDD